MLFHIFIYIVQIKLNNGACITSDGLNNSEMTILNKVDESSSLWLHRESADTDTVVIHLHVNKTCVNASDVIVMAVVQGQYTCVRQEFLFVHVEDLVCSRENLCRSVKEISYSNDNTLCLLNCPKDQKLDGGYGIQLLTGIQEEDMELYGLHIYQEGITWFPPSGWTGPYPDIYWSFDKSEHLRLMEGTQESNFDAQVSGKINSAISLDRTKRQWVDLDIHTEACMTRPETCGEAGGAVSLWLMLNDCLDWSGILTTREPSTGFEIYCREDKMRVWFYLQYGSFKAYPSKPTGWTHVLTNYIGPNNGQGISIFYNGAQVSRDTIKDSDQSLTGDGRIVVGRRSTGSDRDYASVDVDELIFFNRSLSTSEIRTLYNAY